MSPNQSPTREGQTAHHAEPRPIVLPISILPQPDDETCGPTSLHAVYRYWGDDITLDEVIGSAKSLKTAGIGRGTLAVMLGTHALMRSYKATLYTFNLHIFDPTWFDENGKAPSEFLANKLMQQAEAKGVEEPRFRVATASYLEFLALGGSIRFGDITSRLISGYLRDGVPVLTGLSATYLYRCSREFGPNDDYDDIRGEPSGHFVVVHGYNPKTRLAMIADPLADNPGFDGQRYEVPMSRLVPSIVIGVITYDSNLLVVEPVERVKTTE